MKILIVTNEHYFAQKVSARLEDEQHTCQISTDPVEINEFHDIILVSTEDTSIDTIKLIKKNLNSIIIILAPFVSDETVNSQLNAGATDYVLKPFSVDEIARKVRYQEKFNRLKEENILLREQNEFLFRKVKSSNIEYSFPLILNSIDTIEADKIAFDISKKEAKELETIILTQEQEFIYNKILHSRKLLYFCGISHLDDSQREKFFETMQNKNIIVYQDSGIERNGFNTIKIQDKKKILEEQDIMSINAYVKYIVTNFQDKFPDTKLSEMLGISRKSLWEKRKKLGVEKKK